MAGKNRFKSALISLILITVFLFGGCGNKTEGISPSVEEITSLSSAAGFLAAKVQESGGFIASEAQREKASDYAYIYDNAMAAVVLSRAGAQPYAQIIADAIVFAQTHDRTFQDGRLRNTYNSGDPEADAGRTFASKKATVRIPGFWYNGRWQEDLYTVSTSTGNMAWCILALCETARNAPEEKASEYIEAAKRAADFVLTLRSDSGGFTAGYEGWDDAQVKVTYQSTEHNIDLYCAFTALADAVASSDPALSAQYALAAEYARSFVMSMYDEDLHCFYTGTEDDGLTISRGVIPLDTNSLPILAFTGDLADAAEILAFVEERMSVDDGFDFSAGDLDGIWNEGTAQMAVCYLLTGDREKYERIMDYLGTQVLEDGSITAADKDALSTGFIISGTDDLWVYNNEQSIGATCWLAFAQLGINPFDPNIQDPQ